MAYRVCVITTGHLATCPRMLKAADAFVEAGFDVHVVMIRSGGWAVEADRRLRATRRWHAHVVSYDRAADPVRWAVSGVRQRAARAVLDRRPAAGTGLASLTLALSRVAPEIVKVARSIRADFYYSGAAGALGLAALAAGERVPWAVDLEDAHGLEPLEFGDEEQARRMVELEALTTREATFVTAAGEGVAGYYRARHGVQPIVINNVFPLGRPPIARGPRIPSLYWFSQTIGPRRGLDLLVEGLGRAGIPLTLTLRGHSVDTFVADLRNRASAVAPLVELTIEPPADPDEMVAAAAVHDVGVSFEDASIPHRAVCTPNKLFVYLSAGLALAASATPGQSAVLAHAPGAFVPLTSSDASSFEAGIRKWAADSAALDAARLAAWEAAARRWRWDHPCERDALVARVREVLS